MPSLLLFLSGFTLIFKYKVFKSKIVLYTQLLNEATFTIVTFVFFLYYLFGGKMSMNARYNYFGWGLISLIILTVICNVILGTIGGYYTIKEICCKKKNEKQVADKKKLKKKITGEESNISLPIEKKLKKSSKLKGLKVKADGSKATDVRLFLTHTYWLGGRRQCQQRPALKRRKQAEEEEQEQARQREQQFQECAEASEAREQEIRSGPGYRKKEKV